MASAAALHPLNVGARCCIAFLQAFLQMLKGLVLLMNWQLLNIPLTSGVALLHCCRPSCRC
jgi:hypothetical protein